MINKAWLRPAQQPQGASPLFFERLIMSYKVLSEFLGMVVVRGRFDSLKEAKKLAIRIKDTEYRCVEIVNVGDDADIPVIKAKQVKLPKIPIDHNNMLQECFSGKRFLLHDKLGGIVSGSYKPTTDSHVWHDDAGFTYRLKNFTHYTPMPEFEEEGGE